MIVVEGCRADYQHCVNAEILVDNTVDGNRDMWSFPLFPDFGEQITVSENAFPNVVYLP